MDSSMHLNGCRTTQEGRDNIGGIICSGGAGEGSEANPQQFCLRWHNHQASLLSSLPILLDQSHLTDVTLIAEGRKIKAHRVVLSACSAFFSELFRTLDGMQYPVVILPGASFHAVVALLTFMYSGEVNVFEEQISILLSLAETLGIKGLADFNGNSRKSTTPTTETSSSRESEVQSPYQAIKMASPVENFFSKSYNFPPTLFPQALNLATNNSNNVNSEQNNSNNINSNINSGNKINNSNNSNHANMNKMGSTIGNSNVATHSNAKKSYDMFTKFSSPKCDTPSNESTWKQSDSGDKTENGCKERFLTLDDAVQGSIRRSSISRSSNMDTQHRSTPALSINSPSMDVSLKGEEMADPSIPHRFASAPTTPSFNIDEAKVLPATPIKKAGSQETNKRKKIDKIAENLRTQTVSSATDAATIAALSFNKHFLESLKLSATPKSLASHLSPLQLFNKPPTVTPVSANQSSFMARHYMTNECASKTPENLILESSPPNSTSSINCLSPATPPCTPSSIASPITMDITAVSSSENIIKSLQLTHSSAGGMSMGAQPQQLQKPPTSKLYATCFICNKQLSNQYNLRVHLETHQNVRYACNVCTHVSRSKDALRKHVSYRHPGTPSPCDPETKRKRSKANYGQIVKQENITEQSSNLLASFTSQANPMTSLPTFLQAATLQSAFASKSGFLFNSSSATSTEPIGTASIGGTESGTASPKLAQQATLVKDTNPTIPAEDGTDTSKQIANNDIKIDTDLNICEKQTKENNNNY